MNPTYLVTEFCRQHGLSRDLFYNLLREGRGPRVIKAGRRTLISAKAAEEWHQRMEASRHQRKGAA
jgi:predicted DNA-binding transcriptional regulator AlpA